MAEVKKIATRESYGQALVELGAMDERVVAIDADLAGSTKTGVFGKAFPERHFNCGIAECNVMGTAAGMAAMGLIPFASSFAMFATGRAWEIIRNSIGYTRLNVKICASHGGISVGEDGASHQCCEDFALMRAIPGMLVMSPADDVEARKMVRAAYEYNGPVYIRLGRAAIPVFHDEDYEFSIGKGEVLHEGTDIAIISNGVLTYEALKAAERLETEGIHARVINMGTIKPIDADIVVAAAKECGGRIITAEEHSVVGGLGEAVAAVLAEKYPARLRRIGLQDVFGFSGPMAELMVAFGLDADNIVKTAKEFLSE
ncbi:MAG: transketolase family protein [Eubacteriales bacterium]|nr:transketolase family protein [Lachnospiraceae bacterium]MDO4418114.1 transketolase family protein [Eubacteriales bacterium]